MERNRKSISFASDTTDTDLNTEELELELIDGGALEVDKDDELLTVYTEFVDFGKMSSQLEELNIEPKNAEVQRIPLNTSELPIEQAQQILKLIDKFEEDDDVQNVYHTLEITDELISSLADE